jgi:hypothetical protein
MSIVNTDVILTGTSLSRLSLFGQLRTAYFGFLIPETPSLLSVVSCMKLKILDWDILGTLLETTNGREKSKAYNMRLSSDEKNVVFTISAYLNNDTRV